MAATGTSGNSETAANNDVTRALAAQLDELSTSAQSWAGVLENGAARVVSVQEMPGGVKQANSMVVPLKLGLEGGEDQYVVVKYVSLAANSYRDEAHRQRSAHSYGTEVTFYKDVAGIMDGCRVPKMLHCNYSEASEELLVVLDDLRCEPAKSPCQVTGRCTTQQLALDLSQALSALSWLARFHVEGAGVSRGLLGSNTETWAHPLWERGGYWTLEKRAADLDKMDAAWARTCAAFNSEFPSIFSRASVGSLSARLKRAARILDAELASAGANYPALVHGDFKTANLFFSPSKGVAACDFQWTGFGPGVMDVAYLLWTSVDPAVVAEHEHELVDWYAAELEAAAEAAGAPCPYLHEVHTLYRAAFLDYVRFLIGAMWGSVTPATCKENASSINQGMHKRSAAHLAAMVSAADERLAIWEACMDSQLRDAASERREEPALLRPTPLCRWGERPPLQQLLLLSLRLSEAAAAFVEGFYQEASDKGGKVEAAVDKGDDGPATAADLAAEEMIVRGLHAAFGSELKVVGEEGLAEEGLLTSPISDSLPPPLVSILSDLQAALSDDSMDEFLMSTPACADACVAPLGNAGAGVGLDAMTAWVDPLDGTKEYLDNNPSGVTVLVGIAVDGVATAGVIAQPFVKGGSLPWWGGLRGLGLWKGCIPYYGTNPAAPERDGLTVATTRSHPSAAVEKAVDALSPRRHLRVGGAGSKAVLILEGRADAWVFPSKGTKRWDTCAPQALLEADGGFLVTQDGGLYDYGWDAYPRNDDGVFAGKTKAILERFRSTFDWPSGT